MGEDTLTAIQRVLDSGQLASGAEVVEFQSAFSRTVVSGFQCLAVNSGTAALHVPLQAAGIGPGDEVVLPAFTFAGTANAVAATGATPVFADVEMDSGLMDMRHAESLVTSRTAAIVPVHLYGNPVDMDACMKLAAKHSLFVLEDAAQAHMAKFDGRPVGTLGHAAAFSFYATKNMTTGEGGMISTSDSQLAERCQVLLNQGQIRRYEHTLPGWNFRMTNIAAAIGLSQLPHLAEWTQKRQGNAALYRERLPSEILLRLDEGKIHVFHQFTILVMPDQRDALRLHLSENEIQSDVYYPTPLHKQPAFQSAAHLPNAEILAKSVLSIPVHPALSVDDLHRVVDCVTVFLDRESA